MKCLIVDDEPLLADYLRSMLAILWPDLEITGVAHSAREALKLLNASAPDVAFLDIHMPGMTGLQLAGELPTKTRVVFVTAYDQYAVEAFQKAAVDYLLKPVSEERLKVTIKRLQSQSIQSEAIQSQSIQSQTMQSRQDLAQLISELSVEQKQYTQWLKAAKGETTSIIAVSDVVFLKSSQKYTEVVTRDQTHLLRQSIRELEEELDPNEFWRIHRGVMVRVDQIASAEKEFGGKYHIRLKNSQKELVCSKSYAHLFRQS